MLRLQRQVARQRAPSDASVVLHVMACLVVCVVEDCPDEGVWSPGSPTQRIMMHMVEVETQHVDIDSAALHDGSRPMAPRRWPAVVLEGPQRIALFKPACVASQV